MYKHCERPCDREIFTMSLRTSLWFLEPNPAHLVYELGSASINPCPSRYGKRAVQHDSGKRVHPNRVSQKSPVVRSPARMENTWSRSVYFGLESLGFSIPADLMAYL